MEWRLLPPFFLSHNRNFYPICAKNGANVLLFKKKFLLLRCILSKVKII